MTIQRKAYDLCKRVQSSPNRKRVRDLLDQRRRVVDPADGASHARVLIESVARPLHAQFLGFLVVNQRKDELAKGFPPLQAAYSLENWEIEILEHAHLQIARLNNRCLSKLFESNPECRLAVDPYSKYGYVTANTDKSNFLYEEAWADELVEEFQRHPGIAAAAASGNLVKANVPLEKRPTSLDLAQLVDRLQDQILESGPLQTPRTVLQARMTLQSGTPEYAYYSYLCALLSINASLHVLNELLYNAVLSDKLPIVDDDSIIELNGMTRNSVGTGVSIKFQPSDKAGIGELGLLLLDSGFPGRGIDLCRVESQSFSFSKELGEMVVVEVRLIDAALNPYEGIIQN